MAKDIQIAKIDAARRQLETAIDLYFRAGDVIAVHTLAAAARNVLANLCAHRDVISVLQIEHWVEEYIKPEHHGMIHKRFRAPENFFKHADRDPEEVLTFNPEASEYWLIEAVEAYSALTNEEPPLFKAYRAWWMIHHPDLLKEIPSQLQFLLQNVRYAPNERAKFIRDFMKALYDQ